MWEALVVAVIVGVLLGLSLANAYLPWLALLSHSAVVVGVGMAVAVPAGVLYHWALYQALRPRLPPRWWWSPVALNKRLTPAQWRRVRPWFYLGAVSFGVALLGCVGMAMAALRAG